MGDAAAEMLAKEMQAIVAADRWKGRDLSAAPPEKWSHLRPETQQFWIDTAARILAALPAASSEDNAILRARVEDQATEIARLTRIVQMQPPRDGEDVRAETLKEAAGWALREADLLAKRAAEADEAGHDTSADLARESEETARGIAAIIIAALIPGAKP